MLFKDARRIGLLKMVEICEDINISYLLFVDDIMIFKQGSLREIRGIKEILDIYFKTMGMEFNLRKYTILFHEMSEKEKVQILNMFSMNFMDLDQGVKYLDLT
jgi:hypothetical protein